MTVPQHPQQSAEDFLLGGGAPSAKFPTIGTTVAGRITERPYTEQQRDYTTGDLKFWDDGKPQMQLVITLATNERDPQKTDDDGTRRLYVKGQMKNAIAQAVRAAGATMLEHGAHLSVTYAADGERKNPRFNAPKHFTAAYTPAAAAELHAPDPYAALGAPPAVAVPGLTAEQVAAAQANPATAAILAQLQQGQATPAQQAGSVPPPF